MRHWAHIILHLCGAQSSTGHSDRLHRAAAPKKEERSSASSSENYCTNIPYYPHLHTVPVLSSSSHSLASGPVHTRSCVCGWAWVRATSLYQGKNVLKTSMARLLAARHRRGSKLYWTTKRRLANLADARHRKRERRQLQEDLTQWQELGARCSAISSASEDKGLTWRQQAIAQGREIDEEGVKLNEQCAEYISENSLKRGQPRHAVNRKDTSGDGQV